MKNVSLSILPRALAGLLLTLPLATSTRADWTSVPVGGGGFVIGFANSSDGSAIYTRTDVGGAYRWVSATSSWKPITELLPRDAANNGDSFGIGSLAVAPDNANKVYVAIGKWNYSNPSGIYVTNDSSVANPVWTAIDTTIRSYANGGARSFGERLAVDPNNTTVIYYGTNNISGGGTGLKKYVFQTGAWVASSLYSQPPAIGDANVGITFVACDKNGGTVSDGARTVSKYIYVGVYSATAGSGGVYASSDGGLTWTKVSTVAVDKPARGEVAIDGTLYVTYNTGVVKLARGSTAFTSVIPSAGKGYVALAVDPTAAGTVMVASDSASNVIYRSTNAGVNWAAVSRTSNDNEPDGTASVTSTGGLLNISDLLINPANANEVWTGDFLAVQRTSNITASPSVWYCLQKNFEEVVVRGLKSSRTGSPLFSSLSDVDGYSHGDMGSRSIDRFDNPRLERDGGSTTSVDFSEGTYSKDTVLVRAFDSFYGGGTGAVSLNNGESWLRFGQAAGKVVYNNTVGGWEEWDLGPYLKQHRALGNSSVTLSVACDEALDGTTSDIVKFDSKEGVNPPQLILNGGTPVGATADAFVHEYNPSTVYNGTTLQVSFQQNGSWVNRRSFIQFDLSSAATISSAKLRLYRNVATTNRTFSVGIFATNNAAWTESTLNWTNKPSLLSGNSPQYYPSVPSGSKGGRVAISATDPANMVWIDEGSCRVYYSKDRGVNWIRATKGGADFSVTTIYDYENQKQPLSSDRVAAGTFYVFQAAEAGGTVYRSTDGGATWSSLVSLADAYYPRPQYKILAVPGQSGKFWALTQNWNYPAVFKVWNGTALSNVAGISNAVDFSFGAPAPGNSNPSVFVRKNNGTYWISNDATGGSTSTWTQITASVVNSGDIIMEGDRQNYGRVYIGTAGRGMFYTGGSNTRTFYGRDSAVRDGTYAGANQDGLNSTIVEIKNDTTPYNRQGYFQFDLSSYSGTVSSASITLTPTTTGTSGIQHQVSLVADNTWTEDGITWNNKPAASTLLGTYTVTAGTPIVIPVTSQVLAALGSGKKLSIRVACSSAVNSLNLVSYASSENPNLSQQPFLTLTP